MNLFPNYHQGSPTMLFVDGENFAIRYGEELKSRGTGPIHGVYYVPNVYVWPTRFQNPLIQQAKTIRRHYYTSVQGDELKIDEIIDQLKGLGIEQPSVFKKKSGNRSKQVDISLATDMLSHAFHRNYDTAVLVAGDEDYVPLVRAVKSFGRRVLVWFISNGISPVLRREADMFANIDPFLFDENFHF